MSEQLKPCPFCGSEDVTLSERIRDGLDVAFSASYWVHCNGCSFNGSPQRGVAAHDAVAAWNTRATVSAEPEVVEVMREDIADLLRVMGLGDHARPMSPHEVMQTIIIPQIRSQTVFYPEDAAQEDTNVAPEEPK